MESNLRLRIFEAILKNDCQLLNEDLIRNGFVDYICREQITDKTQFDITYYKHKVKFLPFRRFLPFKNEALAMI